MRTEAEVERLRMNMLALRNYLMTTPMHEWTTQSTITAWTGLTGVEVRQVMQEFPAGFVSSTSGYKLAKYASRRDIQHCVTTLLSRSEKMIARAAALSGRLAA